MLHVETAPIATDIIVLGRGHAGDPTQHASLSQGGMQRVDATLRYIDEHWQTFAENESTVVFSGGYAGDRVTGDVPPENREAKLMYDYAANSDILDFTKLPNAAFLIEPASTTTLENLIYSRREVFPETIFTPDNPLGLVSHGELHDGELTGHAWRAEYFTRKVFRGQLLGKEALQHILVTEEDDYQPAASEKNLRLMTQVAFLGLRSISAMQRRERQLMRVKHRLSGVGSKSQPQAA